MKINLAEKFNEISEFWQPNIVGELNNNLIKIAKLKGKYIWHKHEDKDEMLFVVSGVLLTDFRSGRMITTSQGEFLIVPRGVEHFPRTHEEEEVMVMYIEHKNSSIKVNHEV